MGLHIGLAVVTGRRVTHGVFLWVDKKLHEGAFWRCVIGQVFKPRAIRAGCGRVHPFRDFVSGWHRRHGFERGLVLPREMVGVVDSVDVRSF